MSPSISLHCESHHLVLEFWHIPQCLHMPTLGPHQSPLHLTARMRVLLTPYLNICLFKHYVPWTWVLKLKSDGVLLLLKPLQWLITALTLNLIYKPHYGPIPAYGSRFIPHCAPLLPLFHSWIRIILFPSPTPHKTFPTTLVSDLSSDMMSLEKLSEISGKMKSPSYICLQKYVLYLQSIHLCCNFIFLCVWLVHSRLSPSWDSKLCKGQEPHVLLLSTVFGT